MRELVKTLLGLAQCGMSGSFPKNEMIRVLNDLHGVFFEADFKCYKGPPSARPARDSVNGILATTAKSVFPFAGESATAEIFSLKLAIEEGEEINSPKREMANFRLRTLFAACQTHLETMG